MPRKKKAQPKVPQDVLNFDGVTIEGAYPEVDRFLTGLWSLDHALGGGFPGRVLSEIFGPNDSCKSTLTYYLAGRAAIHYGGDIVLNDLEGLNPSYVASVVKAAGFKGKIRFVPASIEEKGKLVPISVESSLRIMTDWFSDDASAAAILDSVSMVASEGEVEGDFGDRNMGQRAFIMGQTVRAIRRWLRNRDKPGNVFFVNHSYPNLGFMGTTTAGGNMIKNGSAVRVSLKVKEKSDSDARIVRGKVEKLRFRLPDSTKEFTFVTIPDYGVHVGLSAVRDCVELGIADETSELYVPLSKGTGIWDELKYLTQIHSRN